MLLRNSHLDMGFQHRCIYLKSAFTSEIADRRAKRLQVYCTSPKPLPVRLVAFGSSEVSRPRGSVDSNHSWTGWTAHILWCVEKYINRKCPVYLNSGYKILCNTSLCAHVLSKRHGASFWTKNKILSLLMNLRSLITMETIFFYMIKIINARSGLKESFRNWPHMCGHLGTYIYNDKSNIV